MVSRVSVASSKWLWAIFEYIPMSMTAMTTEWYALVVEDLSPGASPVRDVEFLTKPSFDI